jgi:hypothetical protein
MMRYWADTIEDAVRPAVIVSALESAGFVGVRHATELGVMSYYRGVSRLSHSTDFRSPQA